MIIAETVTRMTGNQKGKVWKFGFLQEHKGFVYPAAGVAWPAIENLALINKGSMTTDDGQWQKFKSPHEGPRADSDGPFLVQFSRGHVQCTTAEQRIWLDLRALQGPAGCGLFVPKRPKGRQ